MKFFERVLETFKKLAQSQEMKGIEKYGQPLDPLDKKWDWHNMAEEELVDAFKYLEAAKERNREYISKALEKLEGIKPHVSVSTEKQLREAISYLISLLPPAEKKKPTFQDMVEDMLNETGLSPEALRLEIHKWERDKRREENE